MSFNFKFFNFIFFKKEILFLFKGLNKTKHGFNVESIYFLYLTEPNGAIIMKFPIKLSNLEDNSKNIHILYTAINSYLREYIENSILFNLDYYLIYNIYISVYTENDTIF